MELTSRQWNLSKLIYSTSTPGPRNLPPAFVHVYPAGRWPLEYPWQLAEDEKALKTAELLSAWAGE